MRSLGIIYWKKTGVVDLQMPTESLSINLQPGRLKLPHCFFKTLATWFANMNDKQFATKTIERLPDDVNLEVIAQRLAFIAGIRNGLDQIKKGETVPHEEIKRQLATCH